MNKLTGFEIETLSVTIERHTVVIDIKFPINSAIFVHRGISLMMKGMGSMGQIQSYLLAKSETIIW
jgi:hypothetical protein